MTLFEAISHIKDHEDLKEEFEVLNFELSKADRLDKILKSTIIIECSDVKDDATGDVTCVYSLYLESVPREGFYTKDLIGHVTSIEEAKLARASIAKYITKLEEFISDDNS